jgi:hypothetical protein
VRARAAALLVVLLLVATSVGPAAAQPAPGRGGITFVAQTPWVATGGNFLVRVRVDRPAGASVLEFVITVFPAVVTRSEFGETLADRMPDAPLVTLQPVPLMSLSPEPNGDVVLTVPIRDPSAPRDPSRVLLQQRDGVYPVRVELRDRLAGTVVGKFVTHMLHMPELHATPKLGVSLVFPFHAPPALQPDGDRQLPEADALTAMTQGVDAVRSTPFTLAPTPETIAALAASNDAKAKALLTSLRAAAAERTTLTGSFVPANLAALMGAGLDGEVASQIDRGRATLAEALGGRLDGRTWLVEEALDPRVVDALAGRGFDRMLTAEPLLTPIPEQRLTLTRPFVLAGRQTRVQAVAADAGLAAHFDGGANQALAAHHLLADLAVVYLDRPGDDERRGVAAIVPRDWRPTRQFLDVVTTGLALSPIVEAIALDTLFAGVPTAVDDSGANLVRRPAVPTPGSLAEVTTELGAARRNLESLESVLGSDSPAVEMIEAGLLVAESSDLKTARQRDAYVVGAERQIQDQLEAIEMPEGRSFTLTARTGEIPVTFQNNTGSPVRVVVRIESDKLDFPAGTVQSLELNRLNTTQRFPVVTRASGAFPIRITLESPDGHLVVGRARITVRSTAASGASLIVAMGAATFLAVWWGRNAMKGRRARGLVPEQ